MSDWKRVRAVVELPIRGDFSEHDLVWTLKNLLGPHEIHRYINKYRDERPIIPTGRVEIKEFARVARTLK